MGNPLIHKIFFRGGQRPAARSLLAVQSRSLRQPRVRGGCALQRLDMQLITLTNAKYLDQRTKKKVAKKEVSE